MTPQFLRQEAARFRGMAETVDREASKLRFLAMAADFESRATAADLLTEPDVGGAVNVKPGRKTSKAPDKTPDEAVQVMQKNPHGK